MRYSLSSMHSFVEFVFRDSPASKCLERKRESDNCDESLIVFPEGESEVMLQ